MKGKYLIVDKSILPDYFEKVLSKLKKIEVSV